MKNTFLISMFAIIVLSSCNTNSKQEAQADKTISDKEINRCYAFTSDKDTIWMVLNINEKVVEGNLKYQLFQKDQNNGTLKGTLQGDTLIADYTFSAEGMESVREVAFLKKGEDFVEGYGEVIEENGKMKFANTASLNYDNNSILKQTECN